MATKKITLNELRNIVKQIIKEESELNTGDNTNNFLNFIKQTRLQYIQKWQKEIKKYEEHLQTETNEYAIKLKKDEIERLKGLISIYSK
jgi:hypothetical protein